ncbi:MAG: hypothetical protein Q9O62_13985 [Ardenticatenia bacterium]|nr:hypothetical protein [Ardenticatenia bacterium]
MRRVHLWLILVVAVMWASVTARALAQAQVEITSPRSNAVLRGTVSIQGTASMPDFWKYEVHFAPGLNPPDSGWSVLIVREQPVVNGQLAVWDTTTVPDGTYSLRLRVVRFDGNYEEVYIRPVSVQNAAPLPTETPAETPTPVPTLTPGAVEPPSPAEPTTPVVAQPTIVLPPTATPIVLNTVGPVAQAEATPAGANLSLPEDVDLGQALNARALLSACLGGAGFALGLFVFVGLLMGVRRLVRRLIS